MLEHSATLLYCETSSDGTLRPLLDERAEAEFDSEFQPGLRIDERYELRSVLGRGGMGHVFLARDERLDRLVAIKVVARRARTSPDELGEAPAKEARLGALLNHSGIATVFDFGVHSGRYYTVFEYVEGLTLRDVISRRRQDFAGRSFADHYVAGSFTRLRSQQWESCIATSSLRMCASRRMVS